METYGEHDPDRPTPDGLPLVRRRCLAAGFDRMTAGFGIGAGGGWRESGPPSTGSRSSESCRVGRKCGPGMQRNREFQPERATVLEQKILGDIGSGEIQFVITRPDRSMRPYKLQGPSGDQPAVIWLASARCTLILAGVASHRTTVVA